MTMNYPSPYKQQGAVFVTSVVFLVVITLLGVTAMKTATLEERMAGNLRDRNLALQFAEMGLRYAEQHIRDNDPTTNVPIPINGVTGFDQACTGGLCFYGGGADAPVLQANLAWEANCTPDCPIIYDENAAFNTNGIPYNPPDLPAGIRPPTYIIEGIRKMPSGGGGFVYYYRVTVRAQGAQPGTVVWLQEVFRP